MSVDPAEPRDLIIDASVGVKWLVPETHSSEAASLMSSGFRRHVPALFLTEVCQTIWKKVNIRHEISPDDGREIVRSLLLLPLEVHRIEPLIEVSFEIAIQTGRTVSDSVSLALARMKGWTLVTADERLYHSMRGHPLGGLILWVADIPTLFRDQKAVED
jgi:predicted nucleic acid-binding protein